MDINKHPIHRKIYDLCGEIEKLPASDQQTTVVIAASNLHKDADKLVDALRAIKLMILTSKETPHAILGHVLRQCIDAGVTQPYPELNVPNKGI